MNDRRSFPLSIARGWFGLLVLASVALAAGLSLAQGAESRPELPIWPHGLPEGNKPIAAKQVEQLLQRQTEERITYVDRPTLIVYQPRENANGCAVVICPGGGYNILAWKKEGTEIAEWFNSIGVTAFVLKYRVPRRDPEQIHKEPLQDVQRAIRLVRSEALKWNIDPHRIGVLGFSAGGHLTVMAGTKWQTSSYPPMDSIDQVSSRPDFICPIYVAYLGPHYRDNVAELGPLVDVNSKTPPTFQAVSWDDSMRGAQAALLSVELKKAGVPSELHLYSRGGHGYGIRRADNHVAWTWNQRLADWLRVEKWLQRPDTQ